MKFANRHDSVDKDPGARLMIPWRDGARPPDALPGTVPPSLWNIP